MVLPIGLRMAGGWRRSLLLPLTSGIPPRGGSSSPMRGIAITSSELSGRLTAAASLLLGTIWTCASGTRAQGRLSISIGDIWTRSNCFSREDCCPARLMQTQRSLHPAWPRQHPCSRVPAPCCPRTPAVLHMAFPRWPGRPMGGMWPLGAAITPFRYGSQGKVRINVQDGSINEHGFYSPAKGRWHHRTTRNQIDPKSPRKKHPEETVKVNGSVERFGLPLTPTSPCARLPLARRGGGMVDAAVSKTVEGNLMRVRVPPSAPIQTQSISRGLLTSLVRCFVSAPLIR